MHLVAPAELVRELTPKFAGERLPDGRPRVPDGILNRLIDVTDEEAWALLRREDYLRQFAGGWERVHEDRILVGRALTAVFMPKRPDLHDVIDAVGRAEGHGGYEGGQSVWALDHLQPGDVLVADVFGKVEHGPIIGDNLATLMHRKGAAGAVIEGTIRDLRGVRRIPDFNVFMHGVHPSHHIDMTLIGVNVPIRVGGATVLPGDVVFGTATGVQFLPPHLAEAIVDYAENVSRRDRFAKQRIQEGVYSGSQLDRTQWSPEIEEDYRRWMQELLLVRDARR